MTTSYPEGVGSLTGTLTFAPPPEPEYNDPELAALYAQLDTAHDLGQRQHRRDRRGVGRRGARTQTFAMITSDFASREHPEKHPPMKSLTYRGHAMQR